MSDIPLGEMEGVHMERLEAFIEGKNCCAGKNLTEAIAA